MKMLKSKNYPDSSIRKITNDERTKVLAIVGEIKDLMEVGLIESKSRIQFSLDTWMCIPAKGFDKGTGIGRSRDEAVSNAIF